MMLLIVIDDVEYMLATLIRVLMLVICLGATSFAHAETDHVGTELSLPASVSLHIGESAKFDLLFAQAHSSVDTEQVQVDRGSLIWDFPQQATPQPQKQHSTESRQYDPALINSSRMANLLRHDPEEVQPFYQLAIELPVDPVPCLVKGYRVDFSESLNWMLNTNPPSCRISGWKESNLTSITYHHRFLRT